MKHAFLIMAHADFELLRTLISMLDDARNDIYLHIDKKAGKLNADDFVATRANLYVLNERMDVRWGHVSQIKLELLLFETAFNNTPYAYYHLLSGADLPLKSQNYIHNFFDANQGKEFVGFWHKADWQAVSRVSLYYFFMRYERGQKKWINIFFVKSRRLFQRTLLTLKGKRTLEMGYKKGPNWVSITHDFCGYLLSKKDWICTRFRYTQCGDEIFLQTILWNSSFRNNLYNANDIDDGCMREIDWKRGTVTSPYVWRIEDFDYLMQSDKLFARKFSQTIDKNIIDKIYNAIIRDR